MKNLQRFVIVAAIAALMAVGFGVVRAAPQTSATAFHFVFAADSRDDYTVLPAFSQKMVTLSPVFGFFAGDLCGSFDVNCINNTWKPAMDGNNKDGMLAKTFVSRGNHDNGSLTTWQGLWDFQGMATRVGATHYSALSADATYSFDYGNSHFAVIDLPGGGSDTWTSAQITWLDADLTAAEGRGMVHEFVFAHGPMYGVTSGHGDELPSATLKAVLNRHPISAGFHGHEHITQYTHVTPSVESGINSYQEFTLGRAGAPAYSVVKPVDWSANQNAFGDIAVNGNQFTVTVYSQSGAALFSKTFTDGSTPPPTPAVTNTTVTFRSTAAYDGQVLESSETSSVGGSISPTAATFRLGDDASNRQYRAILSFNTGSLPDNAVITGVTLKIRRMGGSTANPYSTLGNIMADIRTGGFNGNPALQPADFQATPSRGALMIIPNTPVSGWSSKAMSSTYFSYINKLGVTQFRLRFKLDDNNNRVADYLSFCSGDYATISYRPALVITYHLP